jgi:hypothetical protein
MEYFDKLIEHLPERHRIALTWFLENKATKQRWPKPLTDGTLLASKAQGIYKPKWTHYCLSIRQNISSNYADNDPEMRPDGTWSLIYAEEASDPRSRDADYANRSLVACMHDRIPIGVMWQINEKPISRYHILGVGIVIDHYQGNFIIEGFTANGLIKSLTSPAELEALSVAQEKTAEVSGAFNPQDIIDAREKILASIVRRRGQPQFRQKLITAYGGKCAITGCNATETLEAVHILPYRGPETNHLSNGLLLRADIHILFDLGLIAIDTSEMIVLISSRLNSTIYAQLAGKHIHIPEVDTYRPNIEVLNQHRAWADL